MYKKLDNIYLADMNISGEPDEENNELDNDEYMGVEQDIESYITFTRATVAMNMARSHT